MVVAFKSTYGYALIDCHALNSIPTRGQMLSIQPYAIKFVGDMVSVNVEHKYN